MIQVTQAELILSTQPCQSELHNRPLALRESHMLNMRCDCDTDSFVEMSIRYAAYDTYKHGPMWFVET